MKIPLININHLTICLVKVNHNSNNQSQQIHNDQDNQAIIDNHYDNWVNNNPREELVKEQRLRSKNQLPNKSLKHQDQTKFSRTK